MNKINRKVEYALIGLKHMRTRQPGELTTVKEISTIYGCPFDVTSKVMQVLANRGVIRSEQGAHGGYQLVRDLNRLSFYELSEMIVGRVEIARCLHESEGDACEIRAKCNVVSPIQTLSRKLTEFYRGLTIGELLDGRASPRAPQTEVRQAAEDASRNLETVR